MKPVLWLMALSVGLVLVGLGVGSDGWTPPWQAWFDPALHTVVADIRAPRSIGAFLVGALLGLGGAVAQGLFRNPLAEPHLLGTAAGASLLMAAALALGWVVGDTEGLPGAPGWSLLLARTGLTALAFAGALGGVLLTLLLARGAAHTLRLLLSGVVVGVVLGAFTQWIMLGSGEAWRTMQAFMLGNTALLGWPAVWLMVAIWGLCLSSACVLAPVLDALTLGEDTARTLGVPLGWARGALVAVLALSTAAAVAQAGLVAFVGLVAPHLARNWVGGRHHALLLAASVLGGALLLGADLLSRGVLPPQDLPVGVLTAVLGGGYLLWLLHRGRVA